MNADVEKHERETRAARLREAVKAAGLGGARTLSAKFGWNESTVKAHLAGRNGFGISAARAYAKAFGVSLPWLYFGIGTISDPFEDTSELIAEVQELFQALPPALQQSQLASLRAIVQAVKSENSSAE